MCNYSVETACSERTPGHVSLDSTAFSQCLSSSVYGAHDNKNIPLLYSAFYPFLWLPWNWLVFPSRPLSASSSPSPNFFSNFYSKKNWYRRDIGKESLGKKLWANSWSETSVYQMNKQEKGISGREKNILNLFKAPHPSTGHLFLSHGPPDLPN